MKYIKFSKRPCLWLVCLSIALSTSGCATYPAWMAASGPSREQVIALPSSEQLEGIKIVEVDNSVVRDLAAKKKPKVLTDVFSSSGFHSYRLGLGDVIEISLWEAPPAVLFGGVRLDIKTGMSSSQVVILPEQMVMDDGCVKVPFAGYIPVAGLSIAEVENEIAKRLSSKANQPQIMVRILKNNSSNVAVVGEVNSSRMMPLTPKGERLLDALASAGGVKQSVKGVSVQLSRGEQTAAVPLEIIIRDPKQNIKLLPGDVVTALFLPQSFTVLGATTKNDEIQFEAQGITLSQALARAGGLMDNRSDARGVFIFRFEESKHVPDRIANKTVGNDIAVQPELVPVIYVVDLRDATSLFVTQNFQIQNRDLVYVANAPSAEFEKFLRLVVTAALPAISVERTLFKDF